MISAACTWPLHPELLDYLANQYVAGGLLTDEAAAPHDAALQRLPPVQPLAHRQDGRRRGSKTSCCGSGIAAAWKPKRFATPCCSSPGRLNQKSGGPSVMVKIDQELIKDLKRPQYWQVTKDRSEHDRRTI